MDNNEINEVSNVSSDNPILDIINELQSKLSEKQVDDNSYSSTPSSNNNIDLSGLDISKLIENLNLNKNKTNMTNSNIDLNNIANIQKAFSSISQPDPRQELLTSLKPFLRKTRQKNIDTYITLLGVMKAFNIFSNKDRD